MTSCADKIDGAAHQQDKQDALKRARTALKESESSLTAVIRDADVQITSLRRQKEVAVKSVHCATSRCDTMQHLIARLCDDCWSVLPALGKNFDTPRALAHNAPNCASCDQPMGSRITYFQQDAVKMPPESAHTLLSSVNAQALADAAMTGKPRVQHVYNIQQAGMEKTWSHMMDMHQPYGNYGHGYNIHRVADSTMMKKDHVLQLVRKQLEQAQMRVSELACAIPNWEQYRRQHKEELEKTSIVRRNAEDHERQTLGRRGRSSSPPAATTSTSVSADDKGCAICLDAPKEIVFQCGHQCCKACSSRLSHCHTCRQYIAQRITLFH